MARHPLGGWQLGLSPKTVNNFRQNTPELIIRDAKRMLHLTDAQCETLQQILLARGVNKWFKARRDIIGLKHAIRIIIHMRSADYNKRNPEHKAAMRWLTTFQGMLGEICKQPRWVEWPDIADPGKAERRLVVKGRGC